MWVFPYMRWNGFFDHWNFCNRVLEQDSRIEDFSSLSSCGKCQLFKFIAPFLGGVGAVFEVSILGKCDEDIFNIEISVVEGCWHGKDHRVHLASVSYEPVRSAIEIKCIVKSKEPGEHTFESGGRGFLGDRMEVGEKGRGRADSVSRRGSGERRRA